MTGKVQACAPFREPGKVKAGRSSVLESLPGAVS